MVFLQPEEIAALRWLSKEFPISPMPMYTDWVGVVSGLSQAAGLKDADACEAMIESLRQRDYFEGGRASGDQFRGAITHVGLDVIRQIDAEGPLPKKVARYLVIQSATILAQAIAGLVIGVLIGLITNAVQSAVTAGLASAIVAGRIPQFRP